jgi:hypothetical protein
LDFVQKRFGFCPTAIGFCPTAIGFCPTAIGFWLQNAGCCGGAGRGEQVAVVTIEKANVAINRLAKDGRLSELCCVIVDELHMVCDLLLLLCFRIHGLDEFREQQFLPFCDWYRQAQVNLNATLLQLLLSYTSLFLCIKNESLLSISKECMEIWC